MLNFFKERLNSLRGISTTGFTHVFVETFGACTNRCYMCPTATVKPHNGVMSDETFKLIISKLKEANFDGELHLYAQNEPFLDKKIIERIYYANKEIPKCKIIMISNFTFMNEELMDEILKAPIYNLSCSMYALDRTNYEKICRRDNFKSSFINQIKFLKKYAEKIPYSYANYIMDTPYVHEDIDFINHYIFDIAPLGFCQEGKVLPLFGSLNNDVKPSKWFYSSCIYTRLKFTANGDISSCPADCGNSIKIGNVNDNKNLKSIYNGKAARDLRKRMLYSNSKEAYCQICFFRRSQSLISYFLPFLHKTNSNDLFNHKLRTQRNSNEQIKEKLVKFNEIFKDGEEEHWVDVINNLRTEFYSHK